METKSMSKAVRVVARVKPPSSSSDPAVQASSGSSVSSVHNRDQSETVRAQFAGSKDSCELDHFYEENEAAASSILTKEIIPLISSVFEGKDANVIAHGARCSGKTLLIQGSEREPGLVILAMAEMLAMAEEKGDSISVSFYEVCHETVYDILDQEKRVVSVLEGAQGKIQLKGLSKVPVKSLSGFQEVYFGLNKIQKLVNEPPLRSHRGVMIHVTKGEANSGSLGRMNFLDMAGYEDSRKQCSDLAPLEITRINKSIYALHNVMYALNANESHVPYRESKLTHMLKDCLQGRNRTLLITCLPREFSQDSFYMLNLASRICLGSKQSMTNATKKSKCTAGSISSSAAQKKHTPLAVSATSRQQTGIRGSLTERKTKLNTPASAIKGRKLFGEASGSLQCKSSSKKMEGKARMAMKKEISIPNVALNVQPSSSEEEVCSSMVVTDSQSSTVEEDHSVPAFSGSETAMEPGYLTTASFSSEAFDTAYENTPRKHQEEFSEDIACKAPAVERDENHSVIEENLIQVNEEENLDKENNRFLDSETASPPLSLQLRELSMNLKSLFNTSNLPSPPEKYQTVLTKSYVEELPQHSEITELKTPERSMPSKIDCSPWKTFSAHSSKLKNSAVGEYLKFLNTADKEDLKKLKGIGEKRATYIVELRQESPEPFKQLDDLKDIGLSEKQIKGLLRKEIGELFQ
ncbi:ATP binding microtubule motor family protein [Raphanus sativus]|uniref:Kinesin-like protein KIN-10C isoform X2 n=1 Tax=Raphanus sativus TaxID=3726 RepID=A0A9W3CGJ5_RAPSA|nr:kinesin-like protein KIN-10C isoform X2 [Raphanus sativus]KAJ4877511.1 ATP binding microtubule motor family protein [Raphanus sativus]